MTDKQIKDQSIHELNLIIRDYANIQDDVESSALTKEVDQRFNKLFSKSNAVKILVEPKQGYIVDANAKACEFYGYTLHGIQKKKIIEINKLTEEEVIEEYKRQKDENRDFFINKQLTATGSIVPVEVRSAKIKKDGNSYFYFLIHNFHRTETGEREIELRFEDRIDVAEVFPDGASLMFAKDLDLIENHARELVTLTQRLTESERRLRSLIKNKDRFFSIISHDLKNSLSAIMGFSRLLADPFPKETEDNKIEIAQRVNISSQKLYSLLENLLEWAKLQQNEIIFSPLEFHIKDTCHEVIDLFSLKAAEKKLSVENKIPEKLSVIADQYMTKSVLRNLVSNAINFTPGGGEVTLEAETENEHVLIKVSDNGMGIESEDIKKLFRIDQKYIQSNTEGETGTGIGLILCKEFVEKNNGRIWVESKPGVGSKFMFTLPK